MQNSDNIIFVSCSQSGRNIEENKGSKVIPKSKNGQKKCPIFKNGNTL